MEDFIDPNSLYYDRLNKKIINDKYAYKYMSHFGLNLCSFILKYHCYLMLQRNIFKKA